MTNLDASIFDFDALKTELGADPFEEKASKQFQRDERFYTLEKDADGNGAAIIRFLPDSERNMIQRMYRINTNIQKNGQKRFVSEFSPMTIGLPCPFQEKWQELWNSGNKDEARTYSRGIRYVTNIKVLKDPAKPENEGKIFLYEMSTRMRDKIRAAIDPSEQDRALGAEPKELFNPLRGNSFKLACKKGANGQITYDSSEVINQVTSIYESAEEALKDIKENTYKLSDLLKPEEFLTYAELQDKLKWVTFQDAPAAEVPVQHAPTQVPTQPLQAEPQVQTEVQTEVQPAQSAQPTQPMQQTQAQKADSLDDLLDGLL